nr:ras-GEF domain-containing family member 1B-A isoform X1 [Aedes albopictus]
MKPALPAKPINIPPPNHHHIVVASSGGSNPINSGSNSKVKQIRKNFTAASKSVDGDSLECGTSSSRRHFPTSHVVATSAPDEQLRVGGVGSGGGRGGSAGGMSTTPLVVASPSSSSPRKNDPMKKHADKKVTPSSPSLGCSNDCCGIILNSNSHKQGLQSHKNGTNCSLSSASTVAKSCFPIEDSKLLKSKKSEQGRIKSSSDSVDSSLSSSSGGFKDPDFIARQTMAFELYKNRDTNTSSSSTCITKPPQHIQSISQYQKSSKQLEQMLAQRLEKSLALGGGGPSATIVMAAGTPPVHPSTATHFRARSIDTGMGSSSLSTSAGSSGGCYLGSSTIPKQIQQKLQEEMKMQCKNIKEKYLIEKRHPQEHYKPAYREAEVKPSQSSTGSRNAMQSKNDGIANNTDDPSLNDDNCLVYRDGNLISGTLETLIKHMVPTDEYYPDQSYLFAFLLSARLFIKPHELLQQACDICHQQQQQLNVHLNNNNNTTIANQQKVQNLSRFACNFVQLLSEWIETFPYDFRDERVMQHVRTMTQKCISIDGKLRTKVSTLLQNLLQRLKTLEKYEEFLDKLNLESSKECDLKHGGQQRSDSRSSSNSFHQSTEKSSSSIHHHTSSSTSSVNSISSISSTLSTPDITDLCPSPSVLAHQLTHIELERLSYIGPEEFVQAFAKENPNVDTSIKDMKKTRNLESYVQWFNRLSYIVATEICKHSKKKQRARVIEYWIETARESFNIGNFNTLMAIIAGLNLSPISRLKKTWAKIQSAKFSILEHQMDPTSNFSSYRSTLKAAMWRSEGATDERQRIVIPFFSLLVKDLYFLNEGCTNKLPNGHINFEKFWQLAKQVNEFIGWKQVTCPYEKNNKIIMFLQTNSILNENTLAMASFDCEPPENSSEKDRYKTLKHEHFNN